MSHGLLIASDWNSIADICQYKHRQNGYNSLATLADKRNRLKIGNIFKNRVLLRISDQGHRLAAGNSFDYQTDVPLLANHCSNPPAQPLVFIVYDNVFVLWKHKTNAEKKLFDGEWVLREVYPPAHDKAPVINSLAKNRKVLYIGPAESVPAHLTEKNANGVTGFVCIIENFKAGQGLVNTPCQVPVMSSDLESYSPS